MHWQIVYIVIINHQVAYMLSSAIPIKSNRISPRRISFHLGEDHFFAAKFKSVFCMFYWKCHHCFNPIWSCFSPKTEYHSYKSGLVLFFTYKVPGLSRTFPRTIPGLFQVWKSRFLRTRIHTENHVPSTQQCYNSLLYALIIFVTFHHKGAFNL